MSVDAGSPLAREWAREEIKKLQRLDLAEMRADEGIPVCPFPKGERAGIRCAKIIVAEMARGGVKRICPEPECLYHDVSDLIKKRREETELKDRFRG